MAAEDRGYSLPIKNTFKSVGIEFLTCNTTKIFSLQNAPLNTLFGVGKKLKL